MSTNKTLTIIIVVILASNIVGGYVLYKDNKTLSRMAVDMERLSAEASYNKAISEGQSMILGGTVKDVLKDGIIFDVYSFGGYMFEEPQDEKRALIYDRTTFKERTVVEIADSQFSADEKDIDFNKISIGDEVELEVMVNNVFPEFIIIETVTVLKY